ncbi:MAG: TIR domain-containing protein [Proteobacteria bacterium]|nr:TIR domain-containing protein [Pseudomonadota bacterium]
MQYTVFISHSSEDSSIVRFIESQLKLSGITPIVAERVRPKTFPQYLPDKIKTLIQQSDCVVSLLTKNGVTSNWVHQEIGYALDRKPLIPIVESDIASESLGFLQGAEYIPLYWGDIGRSVTSLVSWTTDLKTEKEKSENLKGLAIVILGGLFLWGMSQQK